MIKIFLISAFFAASANAGWEWKDTDNNPSSARIRRMANPANSLFANFADFPNMSNFPNLHFPNMPEIKIPKIKMPDIKMPDIKMPDMKMPEIKMPKMTMPDMKFPDIKIPSPNNEYDMSVVTTSNGDTVVTINKDGDVETYYYTVPAGSSKEKTAEILMNAEKGEQQQHQQPVDA